MSKQKATGSARIVGNDAEQLGKTARLLEILVRLDLQNQKGERSQNEMILMLDSIGCAQSEIAHLLGTTTNTVNVALYKAKKKAKKK